MSANDYTDAKYAPQIKTGDAPRRTTAIILQAPCAPVPASEAAPAQPTGRRRYPAPKLIQFPNRSLQNELLLAAKALQEASFLH